MCKLNNNALVKQPLWYKVYLCTSVNNVSINSLE